MKIVKILFLILVCLTLFSCKDSKEEKRQWYVYPSYRKEKLQDPRKEAVAKWLENEPTTRNILGTFKPSPLNYDEWVEKGKKLSDAEFILQEFYINYDGTASPSQIFHTLQYIGTFRSVPFLLKAASDEGLDWEDRKEAFWALSEIRDPQAIHPLIEMLNKAKNSGNVAVIKEILNCFISIGDPCAIPHMEMAIEFVKDERAQSYFCQEIKNVKDNKRQFVIEWVLRSYIRNDATYKNHLPPFRSYKSWLEAGQDIPGIEEELISLLSNKLLPAQDTQLNILRALSDLGTQECVPTLKAIILDSNNDTEIRRRAEDALKVNKSTEATTALEEIGKSLKR